MQGQGTDSGIISGGKSKAMGASHPDPLPEGEGIGPRVDETGPLLLKKISDGYPPSGYGWFRVCDVPTPEDNGMFGVAGLVGLNDVLAQ
jgi:hypothetical protein